MNMSVELSRQSWRRKIGIIGACFVAAFAFAAAPAFAQLNQATSVEGQAADEGKASQQKINSVDDRTLDKAAQYRGKLRDLEKLIAYNERLEALIESLQLESTSLAQQILDSLTLQQSVVPLMPKMIEGLELFVSMDIPFLKQKREDRVSNLSVLIDRGDLTVAEKYRRILEAYQIENDYGRTIEAYKSIVEFEGKELQVNFLKVGRISWVFQTLDRNITAVWDINAGEPVPDGGGRTTGAWKQLDGGYREPINTAIRIASQQLAPDLIIVPLRGPEAFETTSASVE
jgi:hypothetical protein